jgi:glucokinase
MAVIVYADSKSPIVLTSEAQHCPAGSFYKRHKDIIRSFEGHTGVAPSWEDLVSGRGLEYLYFFGTRRRCGAPRIAELADGGDKAALRAFSDYYHFAAEAAQTLALLVRPTGGVYLCGDTTVKNKKHIIRSDFRARFCSNPVHQEALSGFSLAILDKKNLVISGGTRMAQLLLRL